MCLDEDVLIQLEAHKKTLSKPQAISDLTTNHKTSKEVLFLCQVKRFSFVCMAVDLVCLFVSSFVIRSDKESRQREVTPHSPHHKFKVLEKRAEAVFQKSIFNIGLISFFVKPHFFRSNYDKNSCFLAERLVIATSYHIQLLINHLPTAILKPVSALRADENVILYEPKRKCWQKEDIIDPFNRVKVDFVLTDIQSSG